MESRNITTFDGKNLYFWYNPVENATNTLLLIHGFGEYSERYLSLTERLNKEKTYTLIISYAGSLLLLFTYYSLLLKDLRMVSISRYVAVSFALY
ncbi:MAG: hypothetical protein N3B13_07770, partial [Deltaproteobacteria bacterium]|nr:hypothetical protein [Deltaproteobacteria bacterium]